MGFDFEPGEELSLVQQTARELGEQQLRPAIRTSESARTVDAGVRRAWDGVGLSSLELPQALGGAGLGAVARVLVGEELGAADPGAAVALDTLGPALYPLMELADNAALAELAAPLLREPGARALLVTHMDAQLEVSDTRVTGWVPWVPASRADLVVVLTTDGAVAMREGIALQPVHGSGLRAAGGSALQLNAATPVFSRFADAAGAARALGRARLYVASLLLGVLRQASEYARTYAQERVAFGKPIGHHQALAFMLTDMHSAVELARLLVQEAAWLCDAGMPFEAHAASALVETIEASRFVGPGGVQVLGGHGFMQDHPVEKYNREARALSLLLGGIDAARQDAGAALARSDLPVPLSSWEGE